MENEKHIDHFFLVEDNAKPHYIFIPACGFAYVPAQLAFPQAGIQ